MSKNPKFPHFQYGGPMWPQTIPGIPGPPVPDPRFSGLNTTYGQLQQMDAPFVGQWTKTMNDIYANFNQNYSSIIDPRTQYGGNGHSSSKPQNINSTSDEEQFKQWWKGYSKEQGYHYEPGDNARLERDIAKARDVYYDKLNKYNQKEEAYNALSIIGPLGALMMGNKQEQAYKERPKDTLIPEQGFYGFNYQTGGVTGGMFGNFINKTGYTPGTPSFNNAYNIIPGNSISAHPMPNNFNILVHPIYKTGLGNPFLYKRGMPNIQDNNAIGFLEKKLPHYQTGGEIQLAPIQTERGEYIGHLNGEITPVKAKKLHKHMDDDVLTDIVPEGSFIFSRDPAMRLDKQKTYFGEKLDDAILGYSSTIYSEENPDTTLPKEIKFADIIRKNKFTPAEFAKAIVNKFPITDRINDSFSELSKLENKMARSPYVEIIAALSEATRPQQKLQMFKYGGYPKFQYGIPEYEEPYMSDGEEDLYELDSPSRRYFNTQLKTHTSSFTEKGDPYEYSWHPDVNGNPRLYTKKRSEKSEKWRLLNEAGVAEVTRRLNAGRYSNADTVSMPRSRSAKRPNAGRYSDADAVPMPRSRSAKRPKTTDYSSLINPNDFTSPAQTTAANQLPWVPKEPTYVPTKREQLAEYYQQQADKSLHDMKTLLRAGALFLGPRLGTAAIARGGEMIMTKYGPKLLTAADKILRPPPQTTRAVLESTRKTYNHSAAPKRWTKKHYEEWMTNNDYFPGMRYGGYPQYNLGTAVVAAIPAIANLFSANAAAREQRRNMNVTLRELDALQKKNEGLINNTTNAAYATALGNYMSQDPTYTYLDLATPFQRADSTYSDMLNNIDADRASAMSLANQGMNSFMRNAAALGLSPLQAAAYAAQMQGNTFNAAAQTNMNINNQYRNALDQRNRMLSAYDQTTAQDQQYGQNLVRSNRNQLNSNLLSGLYSGYSAKNQGIIDLGAQLAAARMGARNQNANFLNNNRYLQANAWENLAKALQNIKIPTKPDKQAKSSNSSQLYGLQTNPYQYSVPTLDPYQYSVPTLDPYTGPSDPILILPRNQVNFNTK